MTVLCDLLWSVGRSSIRAKNTNRLSKLIIKVDFIIGYRLNQFEVVEKQFKLHYTPTECIAFDCNRLCLWFLHIQILHTSSDILHILIPVLVVVRTNLIHERFKHFCTVS